MLEKVNEYTNISITDQKYIWFMWENKEHLTYDTEHKQVKETAATWFMV